MGKANYHLFFRALEPYWNKTLDGGRRLIWPISAGFLGSIALQQAGVQGGGTAGTGTSLITLV